MPKRESIESRIINYFRDESLDKTSLMFGLVKGEMAKRQPKKRKTSKPREVKDVGAKTDLSGQPSHLGAMSGD